MVIAICYVDVLVFWARNEKDIVGLSSHCMLKEDLEQEDDAAGFLGVHMECNPETGLLNMTLKGLIK
ncbi:hypothetical protein ACHAXS_002289 [Conticribra weissflogii]